MGEREATGDGVKCELCGRKLRPEGRYVIRIEVFADPTMPELKGDEVAALDFDKTMEQLLAEMEHLTADDLLDQVHRRFEYSICATCQPKFLANPLGKPRRFREGEN